MEEVMLESLEILNEDEEDYEEDLISVEDCIEYLHGNEDAGNILYNWLEEEDNLYGDVEDKDILDLCDAATDPEERTKVMMAYRNWSMDTLKEKAFEVARNIVKDPQMVKELLDNASGDMDYLMDCLSEDVYDEMYDEMDTEGIDWDPDMVCDWFKGKTLKDFQ